MAEELITLSVDYSYGELGVDQQLTQTILLRLRAKDIPPPTRPSLHLMLCIDTSGSMMGKPLELVVKSVQVLLEQLTENDTLGLVCFANKGRLLSPPRPVTAEGRAFFEGVLTTLQAIGSSNLSEGLREALKAIPQPETGRLSHIVVLSDGKPNRGMTDKASLRELVASRRGQATLSFFGYGSEHDEELLQTLAAVGRSRYTYIASPEEAPWAFARELGKLFSCVAQELTLQLLPNPETGVGRVFGDVPFERLGRGLVLDLPDMVSEEELELLVEVQLSTPGDVGAYLFGEAVLSYLPMQEGAQVRKRVLPLVLSISASPDLKKSPAVKTRLLLVEVEQAWRSSHQLTERRQYEQAADLLRPLVAKLSEDPTFEDEQSEVREWYEQLLDELKVFSREVDRQRYNRLRKAVHSELVSAPGLVGSRQSGFVDLTTTQRGMLSKLMQNVFGLPHAHLVVKELPDGERGIQFEQKFPILGETSLGRRGDIRLDHASVSRRHVRLVATPDGYLLMPLAPSASTRWNGVEIGNATLLKAGDWFSVGEFVFEFRLGLVLPGSTQG